MQLDHDVDLVADCGPDLSEWFQGILDIRSGDAGAVRRLGCHIERPDLHGGNAFGKETLREPARIEAPGEQVFIRTLRSITRLQAPVFGAFEKRIAPGRANVTVAGTGVVDRYALMGAPAK